MHLHRIGAAALALALSLLLSLPAQAQQVRINGGGASFPFPLYSAWFRHFNRDNRGIRINYQSVGSGTGVRNVINRTFDFGASDAAMTDEEMAQVRGGVLVLPMTAGEIVLAYNLPGIDNVRLPRAVYPLIFSGEITNWSDPR
ncbi:MAG: substrate-binding domain-containing protein, partial [Lamprocystis purpurea]|nr:substrate-binding domain-containing protein [Lamprocystis purpurea]